MSRVLLKVETDAATDAIYVGTHKLQKIFNSPRNAININSIEFIPSSFGTATEVHLLFDPIIEEDDQVAVFDFARAQNMLLSELNGADGALKQVLRASSKTVFTLQTANVNNLFKQMLSIFPVFNSVIISWTIDLDFTLEIDFTELDRPWNMRAEIMNLISNKRSVEDPSLSNVRGKRSLLKAPIRVPEE